MNVIITIAQYVSAILVITGAVTTAVSKVFDRKLKPLTNRDRKQLRFQIVGFASELHRGIAHTRDEYLAVFELIDEYTEICKQLNIQNHVFEAECKYIDKCFQSLDVVNKLTEKFDK